MPCLNLTASTLALLCLLLSNSPLAHSSEIAFNENFRGPLINSKVLDLSDRYTHALTKRSGPLDINVKFLYGVASGDPLPDSVILWTKVAPFLGKQQLPVSGNDKETGFSIIVDYYVSKSLDFKELSASGSVLTNALVDYTIKIDVIKLQPNQIYYYYFSSLGGAVKSTVGKTKTLPSYDADVTKFKLAVFSCAEYPRGFFQAYNASLEENPDLAVHLGDFIYEFGLDKYASSIEKLPIPSRFPLPYNDIVSLRDYRIRHGLYRTDPSLQSLLAQVPLVSVWDDHEFADNASKDGAYNHDPKTEGDWETRKQQAMRAWFEHMPIRANYEDGAGKIYRTFKIGKLLDLIMLDTRIIGRTLSPGPFNSHIINSPNSTILGDTQEKWFFDTLSKSTSRWRLWGNQVMFSQLPKVAGATITSDSWDGYVVNRKRVLDHLVRGKIQNNIIMTGDIHSSWAFNVTHALDADNSKVDEQDSDKTAKGFGRTGAKPEYPVGYEIIAPSVSSPSLAPLPSALAKLLMAVTSKLLFVDLKQHGYMSVEVTRDEVNVGWVFVENVLNPSSTWRTDKAMSFAWRGRE